MLRNCLIISYISNNISNILFICIFSVSVCMNAEISAYLSALETKFGIKVPAYRIHMKLILNFWGPRPLHSQIGN